MVEGAAVEAWKGSMATLDNSSRQRPMDVLVAIVAVLNLKVRERVLGLRLVMLLPLRGAALMVDHGPLVKTLGKGLEVGRRGRRSVAKERKNKTGSIRGEEGRTTRRIGQSNAT